MSTTHRIADGKIVWFGGEIQRKLQKNKMAWMVKEGPKLVKAIQDNISIPCDGINHSAPGDFPKMETGRLMKSVFWEITAGSEPTLLVGFTEKHGLYMEFGVLGGKTITPKNGTFLSWVDSGGTRRFARKVTQGRILPRPFLKRTLKEEVPKIRLSLQEIKWLS